MSIDNGKWTEQDIDYHGKDGEASEQTLALLTSKLYAKQQKKSEIPENHYNIFHVNKGLIDIGGEITHLPNQSPTEIQACITNKNGTVECKNIDNDGNIVDMSRPTIDQGNVHGHTLIENILSRIEVTFDAIKAKFFELYGKIFNRQPKPIIIYGPQLKLTPAQNDQDFCGYKDDEGAWRIAPEFKGCSEFYQNVAIVDLNGLKGLINRSGTWVTPKPNLMSFWEKQWQQNKIKHSILLGIIDKTNQWIIPPVLDFHNASFSIKSDGLYRCTSDASRRCSKYSFNLDEPPLHFDAPSNFPENIILELQSAEAPYPKAENDLWGFVDKEDNWVVQPTFAKVRLFSEGMAAISEDGHQWGFINSTGKIAIKPNYEEVKDFHQSIAWVLNKSWTLIDKNENALTSKGFEEVTDFESNISIARSDYKSYIVNPNGDVYESQGMPISSTFSDDLIPAKNGDGTWGYINKKGEWVIPPTYQSTTSFNEGYAAVTDELWSPPPDHINPIQIEDIIFSNDKSVALINFNIEGKIKAALLDTENGEWLIPGKLTNQPMPLPCRYLGIWSSSREGRTFQITLKDDGEYLFADPRPNKKTLCEYGIRHNSPNWTQNDIDLLCDKERLPPSKGTWEVEDGNMVWHHEEMAAQADVNKIFNQTPTGFSLLEENGKTTRFELIDSIKSNRCTP